ncbi:MAG: hypothetical protein MJZ36_10235 [Bacteroidaceae bacterium]|nr:hypothetical protein [Bacteroidaceae bacterium]
MEESKYSFFESVKSKKCKQLNVAQLLDAICDKHLKEKCESIMAYIHMGNADMASQVKASLPAIVLSELYPEGAPRKQGTGEPTGVLMLDYDDCATEEDARALMDDIQNTWIRNDEIREYIIAVHYSPRMHGVHVWYRWIPGCKSVTECHEHMAQMLGKPDYDKACHDLSRCSFLVHRDYFKILNLSAMEKNGLAAMVMRTALAEVPSDAPHAATATDAVVTTHTDRTFPTEYDGLPLADIVKALTAKCAPKGALDEQGNVREGHRDNTFFKVCCLLRYLCDSNPEWMRTLAPSWALDLDREAPGRVIELIKSACKRNCSFSYPPTLKRTLNELRYDDTAEREDAEAVRAATLETDVRLLEGIEESKQKFIMFPKHVPPIFEEFCGGVKPEWRWAVVLTLLPTLGTLMSRLRAKYLDGRMHSPSFQTVIEAKMASGKQNFSDIADFILTPITQLDLEGNTKLNIYNQEVQQANGAKSISAPPDVCVRKMIGRFTEAGFNATLDTSKGLHIWSGVSEIDEVTSVWRELSYILRLAYDNAAYGRTLQSNKQFRGERRLYLNTFLCGTPRAVRKLYNDPEDGLVSRTMFFKLMLETPGMPVNKVTDRQKMRMLTLLNRIHSRFCINEHGEVAPEQTIDLSYVNRALTKWLERQRLVGVEIGSESWERWRRRDALNGFRAAMVAHTIYMMSAKGGRLTKEMQRIVCTFAEEVATFSLMMHDFKFGAELDNIISEDELKEGTEKTPVLNLLPPVFTLSEAYSCFKQKPQSSVRGLLKRLADQGLITLEGRGTYSKTNKS